MRTRVRELCTRDRFEHVLWNQIISYFHLNFLLKNFILRLKFKRKIDTRASYCYGNL